MVTVKEAQLTASEARTQVSELLRRVEYGGERVIITRNGRPAAAVVSLGDLERLRVIARAQAADSIGRLRASARARGLDRMSEADIAREVTAARAAPARNKKRHA